jgi:molybdopterin-guanine dinucleotide biosynthesis protein A
MVSAQNRRFEDITAVLIAGGQSRRMGVDKRNIELGGVTLIERVHRVLVGLFQRIIVVGSSADDTLMRLGSPVVCDEIPDCATLGGLYTGLLHSSQSRIFAVGCDAPFVNAAVVRAIVEFAPDADVVMARLSTGLEPMQAVYSKQCLPHLEAMARSGNLRLQDLSERPGLRVRDVEEELLRRIDPSLVSFLNLNRPADVELARKLLTHGEGSWTGR